MRRAIVYFLLLMLVRAYSADATPLDDLIAAARQENTLHLYAHSPLRPQGAQELAAAFNKRFGLNVNVQYVASGNMVADVSKVIMQAVSGVAPEWDVMMATDAHHAALWNKKLLVPYDYQKVGVDTQMIYYDRGTVAVSHQIVLPAYNTQLVSAKDIPRSWEDLADAKWKGGKLGVSVATHHLSRLAVGDWGEEKTASFVRALAAGKPTTGRLGELYSRLQLGEVLVGIMSNIFVDPGKKKGAPVALAEGVEPVVAPGDHGGVLKGARHPNAAHLFLVFMTSPEAQQIWQKYTALSSAFIAGTPMHQFVQGKKVIYTKEDQAADVERLARDYGKMLGMQ